MDMEELIVIESCLVKYIVILNLDIKMVLSYIDISMGKVLSLDMQFFKKLIKEHTVLDITKSLMKD